MTFLGTFSRLFHSLWERAHLRRNLAARATAQCGSKAKAAPASEAFCSQTEKKNFLRGKTQTSVKTPSKQQVRLHRVDLEHDHYKWITQKSDITGEPVCVGHINHSIGTHTRKPGASCCWLPAVSWPHSEPQWILGCIPQNKNNTRGVPHSSDLSIIIRTNTSQRNAKTPRQQHISFTLWTHPLTERVLVWRMDKTTRLMENTDIWNQPTLTRCIFYDPPMLATSTKFSITT